MYQDKERTKNEAANLCLDRNDVMIDPTSVEDFQNYDELLNQLQWKGRYLWLGLIAHRDYNNYKYFENIAGTEELDSKIHFWKRGRNFTLVSKLILNLRCTKPKF